MEKSKNERALQICYGKVEDAYYVSGIYFSDYNMLSRFGEWLSVMNGLDNFILYDVDNSHTTGVLMSETDEPKETDDASPIVDENSEKIMGEDTVDNDQVKNID